MLGIYPLFTESAFRSRQLVHLVASIQAQLLQILEVMPRDTTWFGARYAYAVGMGGFLIGPDGVSHV